MVWNFLKFGKKPEYDKVLEDLQVKVTNVETSIRRNKARELSYDSRWMIYSTLLYLIISSATFVFFPEDSDWKILRFLPAVIGPFIIYFVRKIIAAYFRRHIRSLESFLEFLRSEQSSKVEEIKKNEPYYKAKQLLERYETTSRKAPEEAAAVSSAAAPGQPIRHRPVGPQGPVPPQGAQGPQGPGGPRPGANSAGALPQIPQQRPLLHVMQSGGQPAPQQGPPHPQAPQNQLLIGSDGRPLGAPQFPNPQPKVTEKQTWMDKLVEMAVGDSQAATMNAMLIKLQRENEELKQTLLQRDRALAAILTKIPGNENQKPEGQEGTVAQNSDEPREEKYDSIEEAKEPEETKKSELTLEHLAQPEDTVEVETQSRNESKADSKKED